MKFNRSETINIKVLVKAIIIFFLIINTHLYLSSVGAVEVKKVEKKKVEKIKERKQKKIEISEVKPQGLQEPDLAKVNSNIPMDGENLDNTKSSDSNEKAENKTPQEDINQLDSKRITTKIYKSTDPSSELLEEHSSIDTTIDEDVLSKEELIGKKKSGKNAQIWKRKNERVKVSSNKNQVLKPIVGLFILIVVLVLVLDFLWKENFISFPFPNSLKWWTLEDLNLWPLVRQTSALPTELSVRVTSTSLIYQKYQQI